MRVLDLLIFPLLLTASSEAQINSPSDVTICDRFRQQVQPQFTCIHSSTPVAPVWMVTGSVSATILLGTNTGQFQFPSATVTEEQATITVDLSAPGTDLNGTCYSCSISIVGEPTVTSRQGCLKVASPPPCVDTVIVSDVDDTTITFMWVEPVSSLDTCYRVTVCAEGSNCELLTSYSSARTVDSGLTPGTLYTIQVDSYTPAFQQDCVSHNCASNTATNRTRIACTTENSGSILSSGATIAGISVGILVWSVLLTIVTGVITFLCTRRCYNKKSTSSSPNEKSVYYETVQSDSVQMQPSPAYISIEKAK